MALEPIQIFFMFLVFFTLGGLVALIRLTLKPLESRVKARKKARVSKIT